MKNPFETEFSFMEEREGILHFICKPIHFITLSMAQDIVSSRIGFQEGKEMLIFCDTRGIMDSSKEARDYFAREGSLLATAVALFDDRNVASAMMDYYLFRNRPIVPSFYFSEKEEAIKFLKEYKRI